MTSRPVVNSKLGAVTPFNQSRVTNVTGSVFQPNNSFAGSFSRRQFSDGGIKTLPRSKLRDFVSISSITNPALKLSTTDSYIKRHIGNDEGECNEILKTLNVKSIDQLMDETVPAQIRIADDDLFVHNGKSFQAIDSESGVLKKMSELASMNKVYKSYIGQGYYPSITPSVIKRNVLENPKWYTPYTPYQAEIAQGRLEMLLNYQTMICELTGLDISNSSLLDEASAAAEAVSMAYSTHNGKRPKMYVSNSIFPQTIDVM